MAPPIRRPLDLTAAQLYEALDALGFDTNNPDHLIEKFRQIDVGLPAEDEFAATLLWMGRCKFLQKLRQAQYPRESLKHYRVPDLLVIFDYRGKDLPVLIQVKSTYHEHMQWADAYYQRQQQYASLVGLPLLVAWQWRRLGAWALFDSSLLAERHRLSFTDALAETLMSELGGEFWVTFPAGVGLHIEADVKERADGAAAEIGPHGLLEPDVYKMKTRGVYFTDRDNRRVDRLQPPNLWPLLLNSPALYHEDHFDGLSVTISFTISTDDDGLQMTHALLPMLLTYEYREQLNWRSVLDREAFPVSLDALRQAATKGIETGFVQYVLDIQPRTKPGFLPS
jgi:hypothetical protein